MAKSEKTDVERIKDVLVKAGFLSRDAVTKDTADQWTVETQAAWSHAINAAYPGTHGSHKADLLRQPTSFKPVIEQAILRAGEEVQNQLNEAEEAEDGSDSEDTASGDTSSDDSKRDARAERRARREQKNSGSDKSDSGDASQGGNSDDSKQGK